IHVFGLTEKFSKHFPSSLSREESWRSAWRTRNGGLFLNLEGGIKRQLHPTTPWSSRKLAQTKNTIRLSSGPQPASELKRSSWFTNAIKAMSPPR
ncbi:unnamed protein product, partial [Musa banksii]